MDGLASFPPLVLALAVVGMLGAGLSNAILAISIVMIPGFTRLTSARRRSRCARRRSSRRRTPWAPSPGRIRRKRVLPNVASPLIVAVVARDRVRARSPRRQLSLLGFGVQRPTSSWGTMIQDARLEL